jgi:hypothetical protein
MTNKVDIGKFQGVLPFRDSEMVFILILRFFIPVKESKEP